MIKDRTYKNGHGTFFGRLASVLLAVFLAVTLVPSDVHAAVNEKNDKSDKNQEEVQPLREVHKVGVGSKQYCFFVEHNVVLTPEDVQKYAEMSDEDMVADILKRAGLYMKESNCKVESHKKITAEDWIKKGHGFMLDPEDLEVIRTAEPQEGDPIKLYMDLSVYTEPGDEENPPHLYSTYQKTGPRLIFLAVATDEDAKEGESICEEEKKDPEKKDKPKKKKKKETKPPTPKPAPDPEEQLPEYKTIPMADRSGEPVEDTLQEGDPVTLEWIEPEKKADMEGKSFIDRIPGRYAGLAVILGLLAAIIVFAVRRKRES